MNEREAEAFLIWAGWDFTPASQRECRCSPPSWDSPTGEICAACEARADERYEAEWWEALEAERDADTHATDKRCMFSARYEHEGKRYCTRHASALALAWMIKQSGLAP